MRTDFVIDVVRRSATVSDEQIARLDLDEELGEMLAEVAREPRSNTHRGHARGPLARFRKPGTRFGLTRPAMAALLVAAVLATVAAVPPVRAALGELGDTLTGYFDDDDPPGRPLESSDSAPAWLTGEGYIGQRVLASSGPYSLYLAHTPGGDFSFGLDDSVGLGGSAASWERQFEDNAVVVLGPGSRDDPSGLVPLYGVTAANVAEVEMQYEIGPADTAPAPTGGFVLMFDPTRGPAHLLARDQAGQVVQDVPAHRYGTDEPGPAKGRARRSHPQDGDGHRRIEVPAGAEYRG